MSGISHLLLFLLISLLPALSVGQSDHNLTLKPPTPEKEVFTGDSFVITCLTNEKTSAECESTSCSFPRPSVWAQC